MIVDRQSMKTVDEIHSLEDARNQIVYGDCRKFISKLPDNSVDSVVTSPPYWKLRDYGYNEQLGMEESPEQFVESLALFFDDVKRVLKPSGSMWINLGDTFNENSGGGVDNAGNHSSFSKHVIRIKKHQKDKPRRSLLMVPYRFAIKMIDDHGWCCRNMVIWRKKIVKPTSAQNRLTIDYEPIFLFAHNYRDYYFNPESGKWIEEEGDLFAEPKKRERRCVWDLSSNHRNTKGHSASYPVDLAYIPIMASCPKEGLVLDPFMGSGTTAIAAHKWGCDFVGCDFSKDFCLRASKTLSELDS